MQVSKWGNSLAIRIPAAIAEVLELKEGDEIEVRVAGDRAFAVKRDARVERGLAKLRKLQIDLPPGWRFDRDEANAR